MRFSVQEYRSGFPFPTPGNLPDPGIEPASLMSPALAGGFFPTSTTSTTEAYLAGILSGNTSVVPQTEGK